MPKERVFFRDLGTMDYQDAWRYQEELLSANVRVKSARWSKEHETDISARAETIHHFLLVEHPPVYTLGKSGKIEHVLISEEERKAKNIAFYKIDRGGDITFHGPGQIVGYPILDLEKFYTDIGRYMRDIEEVMVRTCRDYGIEAGRSPGETGVWLDAGKKGRERKICAIGIRCSRWITMHGFAFNINTDLGYFTNIIPCGIFNKQVTSLERELGHRVDMEEAKERVQVNFEEVFGVSIVRDQVNNLKTGIENVG
jgi:lipoyl(octanoyl) transferase